MELKNNQIEKSLQLLKVVKNYGIAYLWGEVRSGKTGTAFRYITGWLRSIRKNPH